jgi:hypothetical protein
LERLKVDSFSERAVEQLKLTLELSSVVLSEAVERLERLERLERDSFLASEAIERLELSEIYRSNGERRACLILFRVSVEREPSFLWRRIAGIEPIP